MKIKKIELTNIKGISHYNFEFDIIPNKPTFFVAPNGFGKSSLAIGFNSLKRDKIALDDQHYYKNDDTNRPQLVVTIEDHLGSRELIADDNQNTISNEIDIVVINSQLTPKAVKKNIQGNVIATSHLGIIPTVLVPTIPQKIDFAYNLPIRRRSFGNNGKVLVSIEPIFQSAYILDKIVHEVPLHKFSQVKVSQKIQAIKNQINGFNGTADNIRQLINDNLLVDLNSIEPLLALATIIGDFDGLNGLNTVDCFLSGLQFIEHYQALGKNFKKAHDYQRYIETKGFYERLIADFNTTTHTIKPKEDKKHNQLIVEWPKAHDVSNGERDLLSFVTLLMKSRQQFKKNNCVLVIDEIFDYLDDANLISFQYFITRMIEEMKKMGKNFFPILLTHLDPIHFNHFCFNKHKIKVHYLKNVPHQSNIHLMKLIRLREDASIKNHVDVNYFHYHSNNIDITNEFNALGLNQAWGQSLNFHNFIGDEMTKYLARQNDYDPLAICFGVRIRIEELLFNNIADQNKQQAFLNIHGTKNKLEYCESLGMDVPHAYYLLGIIYNDNLHWKNNTNIITPVAIKLENLTVRKLIRELF